MVTPVVVKALQLLGDLVGPNEGFHSILGGEVESLWVHLLVAVGHPVEVLQVGLLLGGAEAGRGRHRAARGADGGGGDRPSRLEASAVPPWTVHPTQGLLLHVELHQVEIVDILHGQGAGGQLGSDAQLSSHGGGRRRGRLSSPVGGASLQDLSLSKSNHPAGTFSSLYLAIPTPGRVWLNEVKSTETSRVVRPCL